VERLDLKRTIEQEVQSVDPLLSVTTVRSICGGMMFPGDLALKPISVLSGGEKSRVLLGKLLASPCNLLLLDEPTNHLDIYSSEAFMDAVRAFDGTVLLVTHDEQLLREVVTRLIIFDRNQVHFYDGTYDEFLERIGWNDEGGASGPSRTSENKKEQRKEKAKRSNALKQFVKDEQKQVTSLEKSISSLEEEIARQQADLLEGTKTGYSDDMAKLSRELSKNNEKRDQLYHDLERAMELLETKQQQFENQNS
ncbi:MAG: ATP-binding cassette domain-containing protein, partial [Bdellovibrionales bacterium]|nr:ATP-binding cassette domain-containing protein [Bdellovibrionales bacterium]